ncbi:hypothetical protein NE237_022993 [Protea cynaroides]|uniref:DNA helicase n=1 Tax=Protea cynaroides TaxID=273540 RepID=A0A9Q0HGB0_9MAGN|nr:hypothetical protein NE237_022993 [Protea cynaroides]
MEGEKTIKKPSAISLQQFVSIMSPLIDMEKEAEISSSVSSGSSRSLDAAQKRGSTILNLKCVDVQTGLMGKTLLEFQSNKGDVLPAHKFGTHDVVILRPNKADLGSPSLGQGVVYRLKDSSITVAFDDIPEEGLNNPLRLEKVANEVTYRRMKDALIQLSKGVQKGPASDLIPVLFGEKPPSVSKKAVSFTPFNSNLDHSQKDAISKVLSSKDVFLLHGPPGTGKTTTVVEIILQEVKRGSKILACAASNIAVDNIVERLVRHRVKLVRLGHPARLLPQVLESALDAQVLRGDNSSLANDIRKEMKALNGKLLKTKDKNAKRDIRKELRTLSKEERKRQQLAVTDVIKNADVVLTTLTGASSQKLENTSFDLVIIDEAAQALEIACWIALLKGSRCVLAGDHLQLPPTVQSVEAEKKGLGRTLFERLAGLYGDEVVSMLTVQYRMHEHIMGWSSKELYNNKIEAHPSVAAHMLYELEDVKRTLSIEPTLILVDTAGCDMEEKKDEEDSTMNEGEAEVAIAHAKRLFQSGVRPSDIGIITPYAAQVVLLRILRSKDDKLKEVEISTVDGFQGREKEAIIISMVRSNSKKEVGFLSDRRRMNVAVTRARRQCCIICDTETVSSDGFLKRLIEYFEEHAVCIGGYWAFFSSRKCGIIATQMSLKNRASKKDDHSYNRNNDEQCLIRLVCKKGSWKLKSKQNTDRLCSLQFASVTIFSFTAQGLKKIGSEFLHQLRPFGLCLENDWLVFRRTASSSNRTITKTWKNSGSGSGSVYISCSLSSEKQTNGGQLLPRKSNSERNGRVFFLDVNPICYAGSKPSLRSFGYWISLFFSEVTNRDPVIAVLDGERGNEYRRQLLPSYKAHRRKFSVSQRFSRNHVESSHHVITDVLQRCNVPVLKIKGHEADDVVATLVDHVLGKGFRVVIGSPDKDFKQLISEDVQIVMPMPEFGRWSFYTLKHYLAQYNCDPSSDLSLRCIVGDEVDGVPGIQHVAPGFGRKTALKLLKKHGSLENLLNAAAVRTVGKQYAQDALTNYADYLRRNYEVLSLRRDVDVSLQDEWLSERNTCNDAVVLSSFFERLGGEGNLYEQKASYFGD